MNFLAEVLSSAEEVELEEINRKVPELKLIIDDIKSDVVQYLENVYVKYSSRPKQNRELLNQIHDTEIQMKSLMKYAENATKKDLSKSSKELKKNVKSLETINFMIDIVSKLCLMNEKIIQIKTLLKAGDFLKCKQIICELELLIISEIHAEEHLEILNELSTYLHSERCNLNSALENIFHENVVITLNEKGASIEILKGDEKFEPALLALCYQTQVVDLFNDLIHSLWNSFLLPAVNMTTNIEIGTNEVSSFIKINSENCTKKSQYSEVFHNIKLIMEFLKDHFNFRLNNELSTLEYISRSIRDDLSELLIRNCLEDTIPSNVEGLQKFKSVIIEDISKFEEFLTGNKIFVGETTSLVEYANNIDVLYINKKCLDYMAFSIEIMKKDLHDMIEVGEPFNPDNPLDSIIKDFQQCSVSKSTIELIQFAEKIMQKAIKGSDIYAGRLLSTVQNIMRDYGLCVPDYHKKLLQTIPQQVALFHNNCLYICHELTKWNETYCQKLPQPFTSNVGFTNEVNQLQHIASEIFSNYVKEQIKQINEIMKDSGLNGVVLNLQPVTEKCIRQCLRQQELLKTVWHKVLSYTIYNQTLGAILNSLCSCIITYVLKYEDISSSSAEQLTEIINMILIRGPKLFTNPKEVTLFVAMWYKLNELNFVLGASLLDINNRWADGKGPLALHFTPSELKSLIRALFQDNGRRSAVLAKIIE